MHPSAARLLSVGSLSMALATIIGALGAHALKTRLPVDRYEVLQTAVHYQFFHSLGLLALGLLIGQWSLRAPDDPAAAQTARGLRLGARLVIIGMALFSGSLYVLLVPGVPRLLGVITPVGGVCLIAGWLLVAWLLWRGSAAAVR